MPSWVYIITNAAAPGLLKIGFTDRAPEARAQELGATGLPLPYVVAYAVQVSDGRAVESAAHASLAQYHVGKEWFRCPVATAQGAIESLGGIGASGSPLVPGHALEPFFPPESPAQSRRSTRSRDEDLEEESPLPPGHPLRGML
jgi:hypothetical protein